MNIIGKTDTGKKRKKNEDYFIVDSDLGLMIVADGMGGHASGEVASQLAANLCSQQIKRALQTGHVPVFYHVRDNPSFDPRTMLLGDCLIFSNQAVFEASRSDPANHNMGTTLVAALWLDDRLALAHVGDSRGYRIHGDEMTQLTTDHSFVQDQVNKGIISKDDAEKSDLRNMLTRSIGVEENVEVDVSEATIDVDDYVLLCSDGLTKMLDHDQIIQVFLRIQKPDEIVDELIKQANDAGGGDNITVIVAQLEESPFALGVITNRVKGLFKKKSERI